MAHRFSGGTGAVVLCALSSCGAVQTAQFQAEVRCTRLAAEHLGLTFDENAPGEDTKAGPIAFRFVSTGQFVVDERNVSLTADVRKTFTCTGDFNRRLLTSLQIDGTITRPAKLSDWGF